MFVEAILLRAALLGRGERGRARSSRPLTRAEIAMILADRDLRAERRGRKSAH